MADISLQPQIPGPPNTYTPNILWGGFNPMGMGMMGMMGMGMMNPMTIFQSMMQQMTGSWAISNNYPGLQQLQKRDWTDVFSAFLQRVYPSVQYVAWADRMKGC